MDNFFSIIVCCYNSEKYIKDTIESIVAQSYKKWEIIFINDGSTDKTEEIILSYKNKIKNLIYYKQNNKGFSNARNKALELSNTKWIVIIDHDDLCLPNRLQIHFDQINNNTNSKLFFANTIHFNDLGHQIRKNFDIFDMKKINLSKGYASQSLLKEGCFIDSESVVFNKDAAIEVGKFKEKLLYIADYEFFIRMGAKYDFSYSEAIVSKWRVHEEQATQILSKVYKKEYLYLLLLYIFKKNSFKLKIFLSVRFLKEIVKIFIK